MCAFSSSVGDVSSVAIFACVQCSCFNKIESDTVCSTSWLTRKTWLSINYSLRSRSKKTKRDRYHPLKQTQLPPKKYVTYYSCKNHMHARVNTREFTMQHLLYGGGVRKKESKNIKYTVGSVSVSSISNRIEEKKRKICGCYQGTQIRIRREWKRGERCRRRYVPKKGRK